MKTLPPGYILEHRYEILSIIGDGGFGCVYKAVDKMLAQDCAIKQSFFLSDKLIEQYQIEAEVLKSLTHPHLPHFFDSFIAEEAFFWVMSYIPGVTFKQLVDDNGPLEIIDVLNVMKQVGDAVNYMHTANPFPVLHRDIKPANIIVMPTKTAILVDFGLAKTYDGKKTLTAAQAVTPGFSSVEQYGQMLSDVRSDIYSLGSSLFYAVTKKVPTESISRLQNDDIPKLLSKSVKEYGSLRDVILKAMALEPQERYSNVSLFLNDIRALIEQQSNSKYVSLERKEKKTRQKPILLVKQQYTLDKYTNNLHLNIPFLPNGLIRIVRKKNSRPSHASDGKIWDTDTIPFHDNDVENGIVFFYGIFAKDEHNFYPLAFSSPVIRLGDVFDLQIEKLAKKLHLNCKLPKNVKQIIIQRSYISTPESIYDGENVSSKDIVNCDQFSTQIEYNEVPAFYSIFCRYKKTRGIFVSSSGVKFDA
jgi:serine/threonine protein kinase